MGNTQNNAPDLEERFLEPEGWRWHSFTRPTQSGGRKILFGSVFPKDSVPDAVVVCLPGLSEFSEKYYETARTLLDKNIAFWTLDWFGQGGSDRYLKNRQKRHAVSFDEDVEDLRYFITEYVKHACVHPDVGRIPMAMLGHSMGATIGLKYLHKYPDMFECAALIAPLMGLQAVKSIPASALMPLSGALRAMGTSYIMGGSDWKPEMRPFEGPEALCTDPKRVKVHTAWFEHNPELQVGSPTYGWVYHALKACSAVRKQSFLEQIDKTFLICAAEGEHLVDNARIKRACDHLEKCTFKMFEGAHHEIIMEKDEIRDEFFNAFYEMIKETIIERPETLKPF